MNGSPWIGLIFLLGIPLLVVAGILEGNRRRQIRTSASHPAALATELSPGLRPADDARREGESVSEWLERALHSCPALDRRIAEGYAAHHPPRVGEPLDAWVRSWPEWNPDWDPAPQARLQTFEKGDTVDRWANRLARRFGELNLFDEDEIRSLLKARGERLMPKVGESLSDYNERWQGAEDDPSADEF